MHDWKIKEHLKGVTWRERHVTQKCTLPNRINSAPLDARSDVKLGVFAL
jgi:hypothetical protein